MRLSATISAVAALSIVVTTAVHGAERTERVDKKHKARIKAVQKVKPLVDVTFERKRSDTDMLRGFVTYSVPAEKDDKAAYVAYVFVRWGDLDNKLTEHKKEYYHNWDGFVKVKAGRAEVTREFAFDDGTARGRKSRKSAGGRDRSSKARRDQGPGEGSGRDKLLNEKDPSCVVWKSGVVGATDGLLIRLTLRHPAASGSMKVGKFSVPLDIKPKPAQAQSKQTGKSQPAAAP